MVKIKVKNKNGIVQTRNVKDEEKLRKYGYEKVKVTDASGRVQTRIVKSENLINKYAATGEMVGKNPVFTKTDSRIGKLVKQETGEKLKSRMISFGQKYRVDYASLDKIKRMDPQNILKMYINSEILFDTYFEYDRLDSSLYGPFAGERKNTDVDEFITAYESKFGKL